MESSACLNLNHRGSLNRTASFRYPKISSMSLVVVGISIALNGANNARAQDRFYEVETKYIFGFTEGSGIGLEGEKEFSTETVARIGKADGRYWASESK